MREPLGTISLRVALALRLFVWYDSGMATGAENVRLIERTARLQRLVANGAPPVMIETARKLVSDSEALAAAERALDGLVAADPTLQFPPG